MKNIFKTGVLAVLMLAFSCDSFDLDLQNDPNFATPEQAEADFLYNNIQLTYLNLFQATWFPAGWPARMIQGAVGTNYVNAFGPAAYNFIWRQAYSVMFPDVDLLLASTDANPSQYIYSGSARVMKAYAMVTLVDLFNDVPYTEAGLGVENFSPRVDPGADVYAAALALAEEAASILSATPDSEITPAYNAMFANADGWLRAANSLRIKILNNQRNINSGAAAAIEAIRAEGNYISQNSENWEFQFGTNQLNPNTRHPFYNDSYNNVDGTYQSNYFMWELVGEKRDTDASGTEIIVNDPRKNFYFYRSAKRVPLDNANVFSCLGINGLTEDTPTPAHYLAVDPNMPFCATSIQQGYYGRDHGNGSGIPPDGPIRTYYGVYPGGGLFDDGTTQVGQPNNNGVDGALGEGIAPIMQSSFMNFILAENYLGLGDAASARNHLRDGMNDSFDRVFAFSSLIADPNKVVSSNPTTGEDQTIQSVFLDTWADNVSTYVDYVLARYDAASNDSERLNVIMKEYHIAAYGNGIEPYNNLRRTGMPNNLMPLEDPLLANQATFAWSAIYPQEYVNLNQNAVQKAVTDQNFWTTLSPDALY